MRHAIPVTIMRGGTSKGVFIRRADFPEWDDPARRDATILALMGSPDPMQIDGLGGTHSSTSKVMVVGPPARAGVDLEYTFAQVGVDKPVVDWRGNCGNLTSAVAPFAIREGIVAGTAPTSRVVMYNTNTGKTIIAEVPFDGTSVVEEGEARIDGVPGTAAPIITHFLDPAGAVTGRLLPTGRTRDTLSLPGGTVEISIVDVTNPVVFVRARDVGLAGTELPAAANADPALLARLEEIRARAGILAGIHETMESAGRSNMPVIAIVAPPMDYRTVSGAAVAAAQIDLTARIVSMRWIHHAYAGTGAMCTAAAVRLAGTIPHEAAAGRPREGWVTIGHPKGTVSVDAEVVSIGGSVQEVRRVSLMRTARCLVRGEAYVAVAPARV
jgi:2-methylaconitate cis-trans-isomerase PrpF